MILLILLRILLTVISASAFKNQFFTLSFDSFYAYIEIQIYDMPTFTLYEMYFTFSEM